jgi:hypothetical protein
MKYIIFCFLLVQTAFGQMQQSDARQYASTINATDLTQRMLIIASDSMEGRETATPGLQKAAAYIQQQFERDGLQPIWHGDYQQHFPVLRDSLENVALTVNDVALRRDTDFAVSQNAGFNVLLQSGQIVYAGMGLSDTTRNDYANVDARGKMVLVTPNVNQQKAKGKKAAEKIMAPSLYDLQTAAKKNGAIALLVSSDYFPRKPMSTLSNMYVQDFRKDSLPNTFFINDSITAIIMGSDFALTKKPNAKLPIGKAYPVNIALELRKNTQHLESCNVIGMLQGTDKSDEAIIITSHFDHLGKKDSTIYFGADDDGSGTVTVLEIAQAFAQAAKEGMRPKRNIIFMTVSGEEKGLWGSSYYSENPAFPLPKTSVDINIDMIGRVESGRKNDSLNYIYIVGDNRMSSDLRKISEDVNKRTLNFVLDYKFNDPKDPQRIFYRSDHYNFAKNGVPAIFYFNGLHADYHMPSDTPDKINYELLAHRAQLIFYTAWEMANREEMLKRDLD